jgi:hypothetical protein
MADNVTPDPMSQALPELPDDAIVLSDESGDQSAVTPIDAALIKPEMPPTYSRINRQGLLELIDLRSGRVICVQHSIEDLAQKKWDRLIRVDTPQGPVWLEKGLQFDKIYKSNELPYSQVLGSLICQKMVEEGLTLVKATKSLNLDYALVCRWKREHSEFRDMLHEARIDRAEYLHDEVIDEARASRDRKTTIETLKWAAEKGDPERYGNKTKIIGDKNAPVQFIIGTGIVRPGDSGFVAPKEEKGERVVSEVASSPLDEIPEFTTQEEK